ncbi:MAG: homoserine dehydrogenase, partial [Terriglobia bacterium]
VSRNLKYACIYLPYHLMGLESPVSLFSAVLQNRQSGAADQRVQAVMLARTQRAFKAGETLKMGGHQHAIDDILPLLAPAASAADKAPFYLAANKRLRCDVLKGADITLDMLELDGSALYAAWQKTSLKYENR